MFPRRHYGRSSGMGIFGLQLMQLFNFISRSNDYFPVTLGVLALNIIAYLQPGSISWPSLRQGCISVQGVWFQKQWKRMLFSSFLHSSNFHLYYNMASFIWKAISLERHFGTPYFLYMISVFSVGTGGVYLGINCKLAEVLDQSYIRSCAAGFSAVVFALKVVTTHMQPGGVTMVMGMIPVPMRLACWVELVLISVLFLNVSFVRHLAGILVGLAFVSGPLKALMDIPLSFGHYGQGAQADADSEERALQAAIRRSLKKKITTGRPASNTSTSQFNEDRAIQAAIERSFNDLNHRHRSEYIPPYNPNFPPEPPYPSEPRHNPGINFPPEPPYPSEPRHNPGINFLPEPPYPSELRHNPGNNFPPEPPNPIGFHFPPEPPYPSELRHNHGPPEPPYPIGFHFPPEPPYPSELRHNHGPPEPPYPIGFHFPPEPPYLSEPRHNHGMNKSQNLPRAKEKKRAKEKEPKHNEASTFRRRSVDSVSRTSVRRVGVETWDSLDIVRAARVRRFDGTTVEPFRNHSSSKL